MPGLLLLMLLLLGSPAFGAVKTTAYWEDIAVPGMDVTTADHPEENRARKLATLKKALPE
jgi:hypothetical protein